jgi:hypothetical protein
MLFKLKINNTAVIVENIIFLLVWLCFAVFVAKNGESSDNKGLGWLVIALIGIALVCLIVFKVKGKKAL